MADDENLPEPDCNANAPHPRHAVHLFGHDAAEAAVLEAMASRAFHHAWLLSGPVGIGKATLAWRMARQLLSDWEDQPVPDTLSMHPDSAIFRRMAALGEPRLFLCRRPWNEKTKKLSAMITVDEIRRLKSFFTLSAADGGWRVAIVDAADDMNTAAANALLKLLEEPPEKVVIILIAHQPGRLLPTIRSRCRSLSLSPLAPNDLGLALDGIGVDVPPDMSALHQIADGSVGLAVEFLQAEGEEIYAEIIAILSAAPSMNRTRIVALGETCSGRGAETRYDLTRRLILLAISRLAKAAASRTDSVEATAGEADLHQRLAPVPASAVAWATLAQTLSARMNHAVSVNLDPGHVILDTFLQIEAVAAKQIA